jgi:hypothetical protein
LTNHRGQGKSQAHGQKFGQFNRVEFKERSEQAFDSQLGYGREFEERFRYQNTMSNGTAQERASMLVEVRDAERDRQQALALRQAEQLRLQAEQARKLELAEQQKHHQVKEQQRSQGLSLG